MFRQPDARGQQIRQAIERGNVLRLLAFYMQTEGKEPYFKKELVDLMKKNMEKIGDFKKFINGAAHGYSNGVCVGMDLEDVDNRYDELNNAIEELLNKEKHNELKVN